MSVQCITLALQTRQLAMAEKLLLIVLANYANQDMEAWPSHARLARDTCMSRRTVIRAMAKLAEKQLIEVKPRIVRGMQTTSLYRLTFRGDMLAQRGDIDALDAVPTSPKGGVTLAHEPKRTVIEPSGAREASAGEAPASRADMGKEMRALAASLGANKRLR